MADTNFATVKNAFEFLVNRRERCPPHARMGKLEMKNELVIKCFREYPVLKELLPSLKILRHYLYHKIALSIAPIFAPIAPIKRFPEAHKPLRKYRVKCVKSVRDALADVQRRIGRQYVHLSEEEFREMEDTIDVDYVETLCADIWLKEAQKLIDEADEEESERKSNNSRKRRRE